jgi:DUF1680 family protein
MEQKIDFVTRQIIHPFDFKGVQLAPSRFQHQFEETVSYFLSLPNDDILLGFRRRAGMPHPGSELGGWYSNDGSFTPDFDEIFNTFGQWISALSKMYAATQNDEILNKVKELVLEWGKTVEPDGYFFYSRNCNAPHYVYEKTVCGLTDAIIYCHIEPARELLSRITAWAVKNLVRYRLPATPENGTGGNPLIKHKDNEWYTLSENLYRAYIATGDNTYRDFAREWHYNHYWDALANNHPEVMTGLHGYSHVNNICGTAMAYQVTGETRYLKIMTAAYDAFKEYQWMASGGYAPAERMANVKGSNGKEIETVAITFEVPCGSWAGFKLSRYLLTFTGKAAYGEWIERLLYNGIGTALPMRDDHLRRGHTFYYGDYRLSGGRKTYYPVSFPCCSGTYPQAVSEYHNLIYYYDDDALYISQFLPSTVTTRFHGKKVRLDLVTEYPESQEINLNIYPEEPVSFSLKLRIPAWTTAEQIKVGINGETVNHPSIKEGWLVIDHEWRAADRVLIHIPMALRFEPISSSYPRRVALMYGPVWLVLRGEGGGPLRGDISAPEDWIKPAEHPLHFRISGLGNSWSFVPLYELHERENYYAYNDILKDEDEIQQRG